MCIMISCKVGVDGTVYATDGVHSHSAIAEACGIKDDSALNYEFDLVTRTLRQDFTMDAAPFTAKQSHDEAAQRFFDQCAGTPTKLMAYVRRGNFDEQYLLPLLTATAQTAYTAAVAPAQTVHEAAMAPARTAYAAATAPARTAYDAATKAAWCRLFAKPANRIPAWRGERTA